MHTYSLWPYTLKYLFRNYRQCHLKQLLKKFWRYTQKTLVIYTKKTLAIVTKNIGDTDSDNCVKQETANVSK